MPDKRTVGAAATTRADGEFGIPFPALVEQSVAGIYVLQDECFAYCNQMWAAITGYRPDEMIGRHLSEFVVPSFLPEVLARYHQRLNADPPSMHFVTHGLHKDGVRESSIEVHGSRIMFRGRPAVMGVGIDITERLANELELQRSRQQLQELIAYTTRKLDEQRLHFARDLHDLLGGMLTSIKMDATRIRRRADTPDLRELTEGLIALTQKTITTVRQLSQAQRPGELDHLGLGEAIARELAEFSERHAVTHTLRAEVPAERLSPRRATVVHRVFSEALTNVARHARASLVDVELAVEGEHLRFMLQDNGVGFNPDARGSGALGLLSMVERSREIGARLEIFSLPGEGTRLVLTVPLL